VGSGLEAQPSTSLVSISNPIKKDDFGGLFKQHNHYPDNHGFQSNGSYHPANFSISSDSDSDIDCVMPQFEDPTFLDSDKEQEYKAGGDGSELDLLEDLLFWAWGLIFGGGDSEDEDDHKLEEEYLPPAFQEHPAICNAYICAFLLAALKLSIHNAIQMHLEGVALAL
jgi:hypothetical protein